jgi:hypothetical protein
MNSNIEIFIGSTDIFTAVNFEDIVTHPYFLELPSHNVFATTTLLSDPSIVEYRMGLLRNAMDIWNNDGEIELFPVLDIPRYLNNDAKYIKQLETNLKICDPDVIVFIVNYYSENMFDQICLADLRDMMKHHFNAELRIIPSFFRSRSPDTILPRAFSYRDMLINNFCSEMDIVDRYVGPVPFTNYCFNEGEFYLNSYMYTDDQPQTTDIYHIPKNDDGGYSAETLKSKHHEMFTRQLSFSNQTKECADCPFLMNCVSRNVLAYMEDRNIHQCLLPKTLFPSLEKPEQANNYRTEKHKISFIH